MTRARLPPPGMPGTSHLPGPAAGVSPTPTQQLCRPAETALPPRHRKAVLACGPALDAQGSGHSVAGIPSTKAWPAFKMHLSAASNSFREQAGRLRRRLKPAQAAFPAPPGSGPAQAPDAGAHMHSSTRPPPGCSSSAVCVSQPSREGRDHLLLPVLPYKDHLGPGDRRARTSHGQAAEGSLNSSNQKVGRRPAGRNLWAERPGAQSHPTGAPQASPRQRPLQGGRPALQVFPRGGQARDPRLRATCYLRLSLEDPVCYGQSSVPGTASTS